MWRINWAVARRGKSKVETDELDIKEVAMGGVVKKLPGALKPVGNPLSFVRA